MITIMEATGMVRAKITTAGHWYGRRVSARPIAALTITGAIAATCFFLLGVGISVVTGEQPIPWGWYFRYSVIHVLFWVGVALFVRRQVRKES